MIQEQPFKSSAVTLDCFRYINSQREELQEEICTRIAVPELAITDLFEDAFRPIARDGAANIEVMIRLQKHYDRFLKLIMVA
jgi:uncharacterized membrane protein